MARPQRNRSLEAYADAASVACCMDVYSAAGEKLGSVKEVWAHIPPYGHVAKSRFAVADYGPIRGNTHLFYGSNGFVQVAPQRRTGREGEDDLYIPLGAIHHVVAGQSVIVGNDSETCHALFAYRPDCLRALV